jgi:hypothetical protein
LKDALTIVKGLSPGDPSPVLLLTVLILLAAGTAFGGLLLLTACMKRYDATYSSAMFVGSFVMSASLMSAAKYDTFDNLGHGRDLVLYPAGLATLIAGVCLLISDRTAPAVDTATTVPSDSLDHPSYNVRESDLHRHPSVYSSTQDYDELSRMT